MVEFLEFRAVVDGFFLLYFLAIYLESGENRMQSCALFVMCIPFSSHSWGKMQSWTIFGNNKKGRKYFLKSKEKYNVCNGRENDREKSILHKTTQERKFSCWNQRGKPHFLWILPFCRNLLACTGEYFKKQNMNYAVLYNFRVKIELCEENPYITLRNIICIWPWKWFSFLPNKSYSKFT